LHSISTGQLIRNEIAAKSEYGSMLQDIIARGDLVPDNILFEILEKELKTISAQGVPVLILDGVPRNLSQVEELDKRGLNIEAVICLDLSDEEVVSRLSQRWVHAASGRIYHAITHPPKQPGIDDVTGEPLTQRIDDTPEVIRKRLVSYHAQTEPLIQEYCNRANQLNRSPQVAFVRYDASRALEVVFQDVEAACLSWFNL